MNGTPLSLTRTGLLAGAGLFLLTLAALPAPAQEKKAAAKPNLYYLKLAGPYADLPESGFDLTSLLGGGMDKPKGFFDLLSKLEECARDGKEGWVLVDLSSPSLSLNMAQLDELERVFGKIRAGGKKTAAWLTAAGTIQYQVACMCDKILMADMGLLDFKAPSMEVLFYKDVLNLLGIEAVAVRCGEFKGAVEPFVRSSMSAHLKAHYKAMLASINEDLVRRVSKARKLPWDKVRKLQARRVFRAPQALAAGLVDQLTSWNDALAAFKRSRPEDFHVKTLALKKKTLDFSNPFTLFAKLFSGPKKKKFRRDTLVVLQLSGTIVDGEKDQPGSIVAGPVARLVSRLEKNPKVKGVVVRINSPGGSATASERILLALKKLARTKPVVISMGSMAASGGYYITCIGSTIYAEPTTITGSIGVFGLLMNLRALVNRVGLHFEEVTLDDSASMESPFKEPSPEYLSFLKEFVDSTYDRFLSHVTLSRRIPRKRLLKIAGGRVWSGAQALGLGLVDRIGGVDAALADLAARAGLEKGKYDVVSLPTPRNPLSLLAEGLQAESLAEGLPGPVKAFLLGRRDAAATLLRMIRESLRGGSRPVPRVWALAPLGIRVR